MEILVGGGTDGEAIRLFRQSTAIRAFHVGRAVREGRRLEGAVQEALVRELAGSIGPPSKKTKESDENKSLV